MSVSLAAGTATATGGVTGVENVRGGAGDDRLIGDSAANDLRGNGGHDALSGLDGDDTRWGGDGNDVLIGGRGADTLDARQGENLLVAAATTYDANGSALSAIRTEWARGDATYETRIAHLQSGGGLNNGGLLTPTTVIDDAAADRLVGSSTARDWYWGRRPGQAGVTDLFDNLGGDEQVNTPS